MPVEKLNPESFGAEFHAFESELGINPLTLRETLQNYSRLISPARVRNDAGGMDIEVFLSSGSWESVRQIPTSNPRHFEHLKSLFHFTLKEVQEEEGVTRGILGVIGQPNSIVTISDSSIHLEPGS
jgi:hypothetical protein